MSQVLFQYHQPYALQCAVRCVYLRQYVFARRGVVNHLLYAVELPHDAVEPHPNLLRVFKTMSHFPLSLLSDAYYTPGGSLANPP